MKRARMLFLVLTAMLLLLAAAACDTGGPPAQVTPTTGTDQPTATSGGTDQPTKEPTKQVDNGNAKTYTSALGGFSVQMPGKVKETTETGDSALGKLTFYNATVDRGDDAYTAMYVDYPEVILQSDPAQLLDGAFDGVVGTNKVIKQETINVQGSPGIMSEFEHPLGYAWYKAVLQETRLYQLIVIAKDKGKNEAEAERFLDSFKLTNPTTSKATATRGVARVTPTTGGSTGNGQVVTSADGEFKLVMPTKPRTSSRKTTAGGMELTLYSFESIQGKTEHTLVYVDYPEQVTSSQPPEQLLTNAFGGVHGTNPAEVEEATSVQGYPALYGEFNSTSGYVWYQAILRGQRLYQLIAIAPTKAQGDDSAARFFESFEITGEGGGGTTTEPTAETGTGTGTGSGERTGMTGLNKTLKVTINSIRHDDGASEVLKPDEGNAYVFLDITVENVGTKEDSITPAFSRIEDSESFQFSPTYGPHVKNFLNGSIAPGSKLRGTMGYEVDQDATGLEWVYDPPLDGNTLRIALDK